MKHYIIGVGLIIVLVFSFLFTVDTNTLYDQKVLANDIAEDCANSGATFYNNNAFFYGTMEFNDASVCDVTWEIISHEYSLDETRKSSAAYYRDQFDYDIAIFDDSMTARYYHNGVSTGSEPFEYYNKKYTDIKGRVHRINYPSIIVSIDGGRAKFKADLFDDLGVQIKGVGVYEHTTEE